MRRLLQLKHPVQLISRLKYSVFFFLSIGSIDLFSLYLLDETATQLTSRTPGEADFPNGVQGVLA
jgi:hypothetical protein